MAENITSKQLMIASAIIDILRLFADNEIGGQYDILNGINIDIFGGVVQA